MKIAFISRHEPTEAQADLAGVRDGELVPVGDVDGFDAAAVRGLVTAKFNEGFRAFAVVNAALALEICAWAGDVGIGNLGIEIWVLQNGARPTLVAGKMSFVAIGATVWNAAGSGVIVADRITAERLAAHRDMLEACNAHAREDGR